MGRPRKIIPGKDSNINSSGSVSNSSPGNPDFNEEQFITEVVDRKGKPPLSAAQREQRQKAAFSAGLKQKEKQEREALDQEAQKEQDEKFRKRCFAPGVLQTVASLYKYGCLAGIIIGFKLFKIPKSYLPAKPTPPEDAEAWAFSLVDWMVENLGPEAAYKNLTLVCLFGLPCINIGMVVTTARGQMIEDQGKGLLTGPGK